LGYYTLLGEKMVLEAGNHIQNVDIIPGNFYGTTPVLLADESGDTIIDESDTYSILIANESPVLTAGNSSSAVSWPACVESNVTWSSVPN
jgi:hypothetical protein